MTFDGCQTIQKRMRLITEEDATEGSGWNYFSGAFPVSAAWLLSECVTNGACAG